MDSKPRQILEEAQELHRQKEQDYGESWRLTGEIMALILQRQGKEEITIPAEPEALSAFGLYTRRLDKFTRSFLGTFTDDELEVDETVPETTKDSVPYAAMQTALAREMSDMEGREEYPDCAQCDEEAVDRTGLIGQEEEYEYYCTCGEVWWE